MKRTFAIYPLIAAAAILAACSTSESDWKKAQAANTAVAYQDFLTQHPNDAHAQEARDHIQKFDDEQAWADAQKANTADSYQQYLQKEANGAHAEEAHTQLTALARAADWKTAQVANTEQALQDFLQKYSQGPEADEARAQLQKLQSEGYRIVLASAKDEKAATKAHEQLQAKVGNDVPGLAVIPPSGSDKQYRVASGPMTEADAKAACAKLKKAHQRCEVVKR